MRLTHFIYTLAFAALLRTPRLRLILAIGHSALKVNFPTRTSLQSLLSFLAQRTSTIISSGWKLKLQQKSQCLLAKITGIQQGGGDVVTVRKRGKRWTVVDDGSRSSWVL
jgi:hypothetical protein